MCGVIGSLERNGAPADPAIAMGMAQALAHRGPDGDGVWGAITLGHRRLAILDLSDAAAQPMVVAGGRYIFKL